MAREPDDDLTDAALVERVRDGDATAYRGLVEKYQTRVYHVIYGMVRNREDALDLSQETFVKAYRNLHGFRADSRFYTWLYRIAMNVAIDFTRRRARAPVSGLDEAVAARDADGTIAAVHHEGSPRKALERKELHGAILDAVEALPEQQRQIILLREVEGLSYKEIAEVLDVPEGTVMSRLYYARKKLQAELAHLR
ncbi:MAG: sigma-70 family RNA polymerase sigma factor [Alphaproteobacteria bacterium]|nr:sigma-70 family RNA polymerase sigma factor [Alphaproteobacteria bacterium]